MPTMTPLTVSKASTTGGKTLSLMKSNACSTRSRTTSNASTTGGTNLVRTNPTTSAKASFHLGMLSTMNPVTAASTGNSFSPICTPITATLARSFSIERALVSSILANAAAEAPAAPSANEAVVPARPSISLAVKANAPAPASILPNMSIIGSPESARMRIAPSRLPPAAINSGNDSPARPEKTLEALVPSLPNSANMPFNCVPATLAGIPCAVSAAIPIAVSSIDTPNAAEIGATIDSVPANSSIVILPLRTANVDKSAASAAVIPDSAHAFCEVVKRSTAADISIDPPMASSVADSINANTLSTGTPADIASYRAGTTSEGSTPIFADRSRT